MNVKEIFIYFEFKNGPFSNFTSDIKIIAGPQVM